MKENILIIANCRLGDTLVMIPALQWLRNHHPEAHIALASEPSERGLLGAEEILAGRGLVDEFVSLFLSGTLLQRLWERLRFFRKMRRTSWNLGIVMMPPYPPLTMKLVCRFCFYLRGCGVKRILSPREVCEPQRGEQGRWQRMPPVAEKLLELVAEGNRSFELPLPPDNVKQEPRLIAVAPGSNMPSKCWRHYDVVLKELVKRKGVVPVYFGGENERSLIEALNGAVPGIPVIGKPFSQVELEMGKCDLFLGNDTGLAHLAALLGLPGVCIFSCRDIPGIWEPYSPSIKVLRAENIPCERCYKTRCDEPTCLEAITPEQVLALF